MRALAAEWGYTLALLLLRSLVVAGGIAACGYIYARSGLV